MDVIRKTRLNVLHPHWELSIQTLNVACKWLFVLFLFFVLDRHDTDVGVKITNQITMKMPDISLVVITSKKSE
jgi:hypothetical protein